MTTQPCKICRGTGHVECPAQTCAHWCSCTVCNGTGKVEVWEDWSQGFAEEKVRAASVDKIKLIAEWMAMVNDYVRKMHGAEVPAHYLTGRMNEIVKQLCEEEKAR